MYSPVAIPDVAPAPVMSLMCGSTTVSRKGTLNDRLPSRSYAAAAVLGQHKSRIAACTSSEGGKQFQEHIDWDTNHSKSVKLSNNTHKFRANRECECV